MNTIKKRIRTFPKKHVWENNGEHIFFLVEYSFTSTQRSLVYDSYYSAQNSLFTSLNTSINNFLISKLKGL